MSAGLPGCGLGGLFFVICALLAPVRELVRTVQGCSSAAQWAETMRQFGLALAMVVAFGLTWRALGGDVLYLRTVAITTGVLVAVLAAAKVLDLAASLSRRRRRARAAATPRARGRSRYLPETPLAPDPEG
jgi:ABC-type transport system involved in cytochrome c biogenesis permease subunit